MREQTAITEAARLQRMRAIYRATPANTGGIFPDGGEEFTVEVYYDNTLNFPYREPGIIYTAGHEPGCVCETCQNGDGA